MVKAAERLYFAYDATLDADQISMEEALRSKHTHIKKKVLPNDYICVSVDR